MPLDRSLLSEKLKKYRKQFQVTITELSEATGIDEHLLVAYENQEKVPTGDEILILADFYKCDDYMFFISNERSAPFEQTDTLFRRHGNEFSKEDRWAVQEFLYLVACESFLMKSLELPSKSFNFSKRSHIHKINGIEAAAALREFLNYPDHGVKMNIYEDFRSIGIHTFRRALKNSKISGLYIKHPVAGKCILINYSEDVYRQRFTASHEAAHAILNDDEDGVLVSFIGDSRNYVEVGANNFASHYLMPRSFLNSIPDAHTWDQKKALTWANKLKVSTEALAIALSDAKLINKETKQVIESVWVKKELKNDPELSCDLAPNSILRKQVLLKKGLSTYYVNLCFEAFRRNIISGARMAEMLLINRQELYEIAELYNERL
jgi:Zn-dependent peptidase ImmA (M78 family)/transcriptional regulator with XRE-family HTH domain